MAEVQLTAAMADLDSFMVRHTALAFEWGRVDCSTVLADWAIANGWPDPAAQSRGQYSSEDEWRSIVTARGGLLPVIADLCARSGIPVLRERQRGAVGVIGAPHNVERQWGAIFDGAVWQVRQPSGFAPVRAQPLGMWKV